ncbi:MAG: hypothetical protein ABI420_08870 [Opitutaceae bacterium]
MGFTINSLSLKYISLRPATAVPGFGLSALAVDFRAPSPGIYGAATSVLVVLGGVRDSTPHRIC